MRRRVVRIACLLALCGAPAGNLALGQDPDLILTVNDVSGLDGTTINTNVQFDNTGTRDVDGWSYGVCHDTAVLTVSSAVNSSLVQTINAGMMPGFSSTTLLVDGATQGIVIDLFGAVKLAPGIGYNFLDLGYDLHFGLTRIDPSIGTQVSICNILGTPAVADVIVIGGVSITPTKVAGTVTSYQHGPEDTFTAFIGSAFVTVSGTAPDSPTVAVTAGYRDSDVAMDGPRDTQGFSMGVAHAGTYLTVTDLTPIGPLAATNAGAGPAFFTPNLTPAGGPGWTLGVVYNLMGAVFLQFSPAGTAVVQADYVVDNSSLNLVPPMPQVVTELLSWTDGLGAPPVANVVALNGVSVRPLYEYGVVTITVLVISPQSFRRGDCNDDGAVDIADIVANIGLVTGSFPFAAGCPGACDANDDGANDISDSVFIAGYQFQGGPPPPSPFPACGEEPGIDETNCVYESCP
ncbi:MAG: hypothetical protein AB7O52_05695 [Planctomycetota bacterium]